MSEANRIDCEKNSNDAVRFAHHILLTGRKAHKTESSAFSAISAVDDHVGKYGFTRSRNYSM